MKLQRTSLLIAAFFALSKLEVPELVEGFSIEGTTKSSDMMASFCCDGNVVRVKGFMGWSCCRVCGGAMRGQSAVVETICLASAREISSFDAIEGELELDG